VVHKSSPGPLMCPIIFEHKCEVFVHSTDRLVFAVNFAFLCGQTTPPTAPSHVGS
jgi:hypothetical protein